MAPDTKARHEAIAHLLSAKLETLLDVGGNRGELDLFTSGLKVTSINVEGEAADLIYDGSTLPFEDGSFDAVTSLDVLEHIPVSAREDHVRELVRVARWEVLICCPLGSPSHVAAEESVAESYQQLTGSRHRFLDEHLMLGLPTEAELRRIADSTGLQADLFFQGDFRSVNTLFLDGVRLKARPRPRAAIDYLISRKHAGEIKRLEPTAGQFSNRIFLRITKRAIGGS